MRAFITLLLSLLAGDVMSASFQAPMAASQWTSKGDVFSCQLSHEIPYYGQAVLARRAGERQRFYLQEVSPLMKSGKASLVAITPSWKYTGKIRDLGLVPVRKGQKPLVLDDKMSQRLVAQLRLGMTVVATRKPWYGDKVDESLRVALSPVNFSDGYQSYLDCLVGLLPVNFDQVSRSSLLFKGGDDELPARVIRQLENILAYVKADKTVQAFYIDGHTDSQGAMADNLALSKQRAQMVVDYLTNAGISSDQIVMRWHGERYPVATNRTKSGRAKNRRVTVRLNREAIKPKMEEEASG